MTFILSLLLVSTSLFNPAEHAADRPFKAGKKISASHLYVTSMGRTRVQPDGAVRLFSSGASLSVSFSGTSITAKLVDEYRDGTSYNWFSVWIDGAAVHRFATVPGQTEYRLAERLPRGAHVLQLIKDTEGQNGWVDVFSFSASAFKPAPPLPDRRIEFIGNSVTCGMGSLTFPSPCGSGQWFDQHLASEAFGMIAARRLQAAVHLTGVSGMGVFRNWNSASPVMPDVYTAISTDYQNKEPWDFQKFRPHVIVIGLGTNDFSDGAGPVAREPLNQEAFVSAYVKLLSIVISNNPGARILCTSSPMLESWKNDRLLAFIQEAFTIVRQNNPGIMLESFRFKERYTAGCTGHPDRAEHLKIAEELVPAISTVAGWK